MRILIDFQAAQENLHRGIGRWSLSFVKTLLAGSTHEYWLLLNTGLAESVEYYRQEFKGLLPAQRLLYFHPILPVDGRDPANDGRRELSSELWRVLVASIQPDVVLASGAFPGGAFVTLPPIPDSRWVLAVIHYDLIPLLYPEEYLGDPGWRRFYGVGLTCSKQADLLLGISQASCDEAQLHLQLPPERVVNVSSAVSSFFSQMPDDPERALVLAELEIDRSFVLYTGGDDPRKNLDGLIKAYGLMPPDVRYRHQLVVVCQVTSGTRKRLEKLQQSLGLNANDVILTGKVSDEDLRHLYSACRLFVFPSWHEGFGLPVLEAMQCGAAVLASDKSSLPEIVQLPEALFDPHDAEAMAVKMARGLEDDDFWSHLVASSVKKSQRFSWQTTAKVALEAMEQAVNRRCAFSHEGEVATQRAGQVASRRPRLAFVSPLPPDESGIASYACELLQALSRYYEIEVVSEREWCSNEWIQGNLPIRPPSWLKKHGQEYDRIVYQFGNSHFHHFMLGLLRLHPGVVALHDLYLGDMLSDLANRSAQPELLVKEAWDSHGLGVFSGATTMGDVCRDYPCSRFVFDVAPGVILHSWHARSLAENYFSGSLQGKVQVIPLNSLRRQLPSKQEARRVLNLSEDEFVCACFGIVAPSKCNDRLAEAWRLVNRVHPGAKLVFVGSDQYWPGGKGLQPCLLNLPGATVTGRVSDERYACYLAAADMAVQLRKTSRGETSAAVLDALAAGLPTVVNRHGFMAELPDDVVTKVPDHFSNEELADAVLSLMADTGACARFAERGVDYIASIHDPEICAQKYHEWIEASYERAAGQFLPPAVSRTSQLLQRLPSRERQSMRSSAAKAMAFIQKQFASPARLLCDITQMQAHDYGTGVHRVVRNVTNCYLKNPWEGLTTELVCSMPDDADGDRLCYAHGYVGRHLVPQTLEWQDRAIIPHPGDVYLGIDLSLRTPFAALWNGFLRHVSASYFCLYDTLPLEHPEWFDEPLCEHFHRWISGVVGYGDGVVCISRTTADSLHTWLGQCGLKRHRLQPLKIGYFHLGSDYRAVVEKTGDRSSPDFIRLPSGEPAFLSVSTVEVRKGYKQLVAAFELLWKQGMAVHLMIVGKRGWGVEPLLARLDRHPERNRRLHWLESASDAELADCYDRATCVIAASEGEGFGLSLIEAAHHGKPILCRDLPVFREVAGDYASYFAGREPEALAAAIERWLALFRKNQVPSSAHVPFLTWEASARQLKHVIQNEQWVYEWSGDKHYRERNHALTAKPEELKTPK